MKRSLLALGGLLFAVLAAGACGDDDDSATAGRLDVLASNSIVSDWAGQVGGGLVSVTPIVPNDADVHTFVLSPSDIRAIAAADLVVTVGAGLEGTFEGAIKENINGSLVVLADGLDPEIAGDGDGDPHIWMDIDLAAAAVEEIAAALAELDPENAASYDVNAARYIDQLHALDAEITGLVAELPEERRHLVTFHDAFGYFASRYGLDIIGFVVENPEEEPAAGDLASLIDAMKAEGITRIYREPQFDARFIDQVANETGAEVRVIPSGSLSDDWPTYIDFLRTITHGIAD